MSEYYHIVPWYNSEEWCNVYDKIYSSNSSIVNKQEALSQLLVWKARCPSLPSGVESTLTLLEVHIQDANNLDNVVNEQLLRLAYSSAIMRFVNHMLDAEAAKGTSLYQAAKNMDIPDWIIDMRHDSAHSNNLPSIELLREASLISLDWLQIHYWNKYKQYIKDYTAGQKEVDSNEEVKVGAVMSFCISLSICAHSKCKIKNLAEIPDATLRESIANDARDLFGDLIDLSNLKTVSVMALLNILNNQAKKLFKTKSTVLHVNKALLGDDSLFLSLELVNYLGDSHFTRTNQLGRHYVQCFELLLTFLHSNDLLLDFILELIKISQCEDNEDYRRHLAALWVSEILKALKKSRNFMNKIKKVNPNDVDSKKRKDLKLLFHHWFPNEKLNGLLLDLHKPIPIELLHINFIQPILTSYNTYLTYFIKDLIDLLEPELSKNTAVKICKLAKLISSPKITTASLSSKIYTVEDLKVAENMATTSIQDESVVIDSDCSMLDENAASSNVIDSRSSFWSLASSCHSWATCPIGQLPWHNTVSNKME